MILSGNIIKQRMQGESLGICSCVHEEILVRQAADVSILFEVVWTQLLEEEIDCFGGDSKAALLERRVKETWVLVSHVAIHLMSCGHGDLVAGYVTHGCVHAIMFNICFGTVSILSFSYFRSRTADV
jgi:hypothetical protein